MPNIPRVLLKMLAFIWDVESGSIPIPEWVDWGILSEVRLLIYRVLHLRTGRRVKATCRVALEYTNVVLDLDLGSWILHLR
jgi:hypothetical protein